MLGSVWINFHTGTCACQDKGAVQHACRLPVPCGSKPTKAALVGWCRGSLQSTHGVEQIGTVVRGAHRGNRAPTTAKVTVVWLSAVIRAAYLPVLYWPLVS